MSKQEAPKTGMRLASFLGGLLAIFLGIIMITLKDQHHLNLYHAWGWLLVIVGGIDIWFARPWK